MKLYFDTVINDGNGLPVEGATVSFLIDDVAQTTYATSAMGGGATSSVTDENGLYQRYVPDGTYTIRHSYTFAGTPYTVDIDDVQIYDDSEQEEIVNRAVIVPDGEGGITIPAIAARVGKFLYFDSEGDAQAAPGTGNLNLTSTTSNSIAGSGSKSFTATPGAQTAIGMDYKVSDADDPANYMYGYVTAYDSGTGALTLTITDSGGSGTKTNWSITPAPAGNALTLSGGTLSGNLGILGAPSNPLSVTGNADISGALGIGTTSLTGWSLNVRKNPTGSTSTIGVNSSGIIQSGVTTAHAAFTTYQLATAAASFTLTTLRHYFADQITIGAGSAVTDQFGFAVSSSLTGATNNYAFYSGLTAASGRWAFYGAGSAASYFGGNVTFAKSAIETVFTITDGASVDIDPANGGMQFWTLGDNRTATATNFTNGQSITLHVADGTAYAVTWPTMTWVGGSAPTLPTTGYAIIVLWKAGGTLYGKYVGNVA